MLIYSDKHFIKAHQDIRNPYYNHSYDRYVRDAMCSKCGHKIGEQVTYSKGEEGFAFVEKAAQHYSYCPYCGEHLYEQKDVLKMIDDIVGQLDCSDRYAKEQNNSDVPSVWKIQNSHIRELINIVKNTIES